jgi:hypothetical protein
LLVACTSDADPSLDRADAPEDPVEEESAALDYIWDRIGQQKDPEYIRLVMVDELRGSMTREQIAESVICFPPEFTARVMEQELEEINENEARVVAKFTVVDPAEGGDDPDVDEVIRVWEFTRVGEEWRISGLPDCPYEPRTG